MQFKTVSSPHTLSNSSVNKVMFKVLLALVPGALVSCWFFGWGVVSNLVLACGFGLLGEATVLLMRKRPIKPALRDGSVIVTACLLALAIPAYTPVWLIAVGMLFAVVFGKQLYGGLGYNPFNPAMVGYVVLLISFPAQMSLWPEPSNTNLSLMQTLAYISGHAPDITSDALSGATALDYTKTQLTQSLLLSELQHQSIYGSLGAAHWEWIALAYLIGGLYLIVAGVMPWHAPVAMLVALFICAQLFHIYDANQFTNGLFHWFSGGAMLGAFFIITDPVSGCTSNRGRLIFGAMVGVLVYIIRTWGGYPDGIAFAVLLANMSAPMIDYYTKPRVFGTGASRG